MVSRKKQILPLIACGFAFGLWGLNTPFIKMSLSSLPVSLILTLKLTIGALVFSILARRNWKPLQFKLQRRIVLATICGYVLTMALLYEGIKLNGGLNTSLIYLLAPLLLYVLSIELLKERFNSRLLIGLIIGMVGAVLIISAPLFKDGMAVGSNLLGNLFVVAAIFTDVLGTILIKPALTKVSPLQMTAIRFNIAAITLVPFALFQLRNLSAIQISPIAYIGLGYNVIFATLIAFYIYHWGLKRISGEQASPLQYIDPMAGAIGSILLLNEQLTLVMIVGVILVIGGLYFGEGKKSIRHRQLSHHR